MKSIKKLMLVFIIVVSIYLVITCSNENAEQNAYFEASESIIESVVEIEEESTDEDDTVIANSSENNLDSATDDTDNDQNNMNKLSLESE